MSPAAQIPSRPVVAYIGVGSNIDPERHVPAALDLLASRVELTGVSTFYRTAPLGRPEQAPYANGVWALRTTRSPRELRDLLQGVEALVGRRRQADRYASRRIDLDLLMYGDRAFQDGDITLPDPDVRHRAFVAIPLLELAPELKLPDSGEPLAWAAKGILGARLRPDVRLTRELQRRAA